MQKVSGTVGLAILGAGAMGAYHAETAAVRIPGSHLVVVGDPQPGLAERVAAQFGCRATADIASLLSDEAVDGVIIAAPARFHADLIVAAARAGKAVFCEKPIADTIEDADRAIAAADQAGVPLQVGFQRRFDRGYRQARELVERGVLGQVQLLRSITRDPDLEDPSRVPQWAVFRETLIHDFDALRFLAGGAEPVEVFAMADALVRPDWKERGLLDTAVVMLRYDNGAMATADASFQAVYGYDVRAEVLGSKGATMVGSGRQTSAVHLSRQGEARKLVHWFLDLFGQAYIDELVHFAECVRTGARPDCTGADGRAALAIALAAARSVETRRPVSIDEVLPTH